MGGGRGRRAWLALAALLAPALAWAGPPYTTDDPEPVELHHWEVYLATVDQWSREAGWSGTAPHLEVNYGALPDVQLHAIAPLAWAHAPGGGTSLGYGDTELGAKVRFVHEGERVPQIGVFPLLELPTGDASRGLGAGQTQLFLPLWLQKSFGPWTSYGGGGYWINPGPGNRNWWYFGWQAQRRLGEGVALGAELFHGTARQDGGSGETRFNVGVVLDFGELHHVLVSAGRALDKQAAQAYLAYQLTFGPGGEAPAPEDGHEGH
ncbi:hypothetical protein AMYX_12370 [Anaeromyxobacter diazotrophicus]|uniref:Transporter n=2 Tax=Anaeromyxobacter diazotrophicus TaxID=2590199 RepID=A0A7I9VJA0_9BACT|nr:hypothetical protein AMYX_12370 [Anaeromyxobacter diazotrophicus]